MSVRGRVASENEARGWRCFATRPRALLVFNLRRIHRAIVFGLVVGSLALPAAPGTAQELEPRAYANAPVGLNFVLVNYGFASGGFAADPALPIEDVELRFHGPLVGYARSLGIAGKAAKIAVVVPTGFLSGQGTFESVVHERDTSGLYDPRVRLSVDLLGAPALSPREFASYRQDWILGVSLQLTAPLGQYDPDFVVNLGANRWSIKPEIGVSKAVGRWIFELVASATWYTDNDDFGGGQTREQDMITAVQAHAIYTFRSRIWVAADWTEYRGGAATVDGTPLTGSLNADRLGLTLSLPVTRHDSLKFSWSAGVAVRTADDYNAASVTWQHIWGGGL